MSCTAENFRGVCSKLYGGACRTIELMGPNDDRRTEAATINSDAFQTTCTTPVKTRFKIHSTHAREFVKCLKDRSDARGEIYIPSGVSEKLFPS